MDNKTTLELVDDAARANWGGSWRMPTDAEITELKDQCSWTWTTQNSVNGCLVTGPNGNSIFLPSAGCRNGGSLDNAGTGGMYYSSSKLDFGIMPQAVSVLSSGSDGPHTSLGGRALGLNVRPVTE